VSIAKHIDAYLHTVLKKKSIGYEIPYQVSKDSELLAYDMHLNT